MNRKCFVVMPIGNKKDGSFDGHHDIYTFLIRPAVEESGFHCLRADEIRKSGSIIKEIIDQVDEADVVIADLTGSNPNVFYELGVRHSIAGRSIMITQNVREVPFDLRPYRVIEYNLSLSGQANFRKELIHYIRDIVDNPKSPDNPVQDHFSGQRGMGMRMKINALSAEIDSLKRELASYSSLWPVPSNLPQIPIGNYKENVLSLRERLREKVIIVDDDPGGMHALSNVSFYLSIDDRTLHTAMDSNNAIIFIITDTRSHKKHDAVAINKTLGTFLGRHMITSNQRITVLSRGDSTLRGHYPDESDALRSSIEESSGIKYVSEIFIPAYLEAGRITLCGIHWIREGSCLRPVALTDYAKDPTYHYDESNLIQWMKSKLKVAHENKTDIISLEDIRLRGVNYIKDKLTNVKCYTRFICEAMEREDLDVIANSVCEAERDGYRIFTRTGPSFLASRCGLQSDTKSVELKTPINKPGLLIIGSITDLSRKQRLEASVIEGVESIELDATKLYNPYLRRDELKTKRELIINSINSGHDVILFTSDYYAEEGELPLDAKGRVLFAMADITKQVLDFIGYIVAKGSDTAYLLMKESINIDHGIFAGTILPNIGLCQKVTGQVTWDKPIFIIAGNTGSTSCIADLIKMIRKHNESHVLTKS